MYVLLTPRFNSKITNIAAIFPIPDFVECGKRKGEETVENFFKAMLLDGYRHLYRGITRPVWKKHFTNQDGLKPSENIQFLINTSVFIAHGQKGTNIHYSHSVKFFKNLQSLSHPKNQLHKLKLIQNGTHNNETAKEAITKYFKWQKIPQIKEDKKL